MIRKFIRKYKIKAKKLLTVIFISIIEIVLFLWSNNWMPSPIVLVPLIQLALIFEKKNVWARLTEKEKKEILLSESDVDNFVRGVEKLLESGKTSREILKEIKREE